MKKKNGMTEWYRSKQKNNIVFQKKKITKVNSSDDVRVHQNV